MQKIFQEYGGVIVTALAIVALIGVVGLMFTPAGDGWMDGSFHSVVDKFGDKADDAIDEVQVGNTGPSLINVRDNYDWVEDKRIVTAGTIASYDGAAYVRIPVAEGDVWCVWYQAESFLAAGSHGAVRLEDSQNTLVSAVDLSQQPKCKIDSSTLVRGAVLEVPAGVSYMCVNLQFSTTDHRDSAIIAKYDSQLTWVAVGDSLTQHHSDFDNYVMLSSYRMSLPVLNYGRGGAGYSRLSGTYSFVDRVRNITPETDLVTFFGSLNDMAVLSDSVTIGSASDVYVDGADNSLAACMNYCYDYILTNCPDTKIAVIAPTPWSDSSPSNPSHNHTRYVEVMKEICEAKDIPFLDLYQNSGLNPWDNDFKEQYYLNADGTHPNAEGSKLLEKKITPFIKSVLES